MNWSPSPDASARRCSSRTACTSRPGTRSTFPGSRFPCTSCTPSALVPVAGRVSAPLFEQDCVYESPWHTVDVPGLAGSRAGRTGESARNIDLPCLWRPIAGVLHDLDRTRRGAHLGRVKPVFPCSTCLWAGVNAFEVPATSLSSRRCSSGRAGCTHSWSNGSTQIASSIGRSSTDRSTRLPGDSHLGWMGNTARPVVAVAGSPSACRSPAASTSNSRGTSG